MWLALPHDWKKSTKENYESNLNLYVYPAFGKRQVTEISRKDLKAFFDNLLIKGLSRSTVALIKAPINGVFSYTVESEILESNPLNELKLYRKKSTFKGEPFKTVDVGELGQRSI